MIRKGDAPVLLPFSEVFKDGETIPYAEQKRA